MSKSPKRCKAIKYRIYPTAEQEVLITKTFGCVRFVYNQMLGYCERLHAAGEKYPGVFALNYELKHLKKQYDWLYEVDATALEVANEALHAGYTKFFQKSGGHPKFHKKEYSGSYTSRFINGNIVVQEKYIRLPKLGFVKAVVHRTAPEDWALKRATVSRNSDGTYYCSVMYQLPDPLPEKFDLSYDGFTAVGLDYKSDGLFATNDGVVAGMPKFFSKSEAKLARLQRNLSRKKGSKKGEKKSKNWLKQHRKVAKLQAHIAHQRLDYLHKMSTEIANQYDIVCVETLNMKTMSNKGFGNGKATLDNGYGMFLNFLEYKLNDRGKYLVKIDKWYPFSQTCCKCGLIHPEMKDLTNREMICCCGNHMDRDVNAAINILTEGLFALPA